MSSFTDPQRRNSMDNPPRMQSSHDATVIDAGPSAVYQLNTKRTLIDGNHKKIRRWTYGQKPKNKQNKVILMETKTQTSEITVYEVFVEENPTALTIIDTPGYGDTRGHEKDAEISEYLRRLFAAEDGVHYIDAVCFVLKASQNRLSGKELYIFHSVLSLFGRDIENNIVFLLTHSDGRYPTNALSVIKKAQIHCKRDVKKQAVHLLFNNLQKEKRDEQNKCVLKSSWEMGEKSMGEFFTLLEENNRKSVQMTLDVLKERRRLEACVCNLKKRITDKEIKTKELTEIQEALGQNRHNIKSWDKFQFTVNTAVKEKVSTDNEWWWNRNPTCCNVCEENCHVNCWESDDSCCEVMKKNQCTKCTGKCHFSDHVRESKKYVLKRKTVIMAFDALKQDYERTGEKPKTSFDKRIYENITKEHEALTKDSENKAEIEAKLTSDLEATKCEISKLLHEAFITIMSLSEIALKADSAFTLQHLDFLIPRLKEEGIDDRVKLLEDQRKAGDEQKNQGALRHVLELTGGKKKQSDSRVTAAMASSKHHHRRKSLDEPPEKIAGVIRLKDEFIDLYERDYPELQHCTDRMTHTVEHFEKTYIHNTEGSSMSGWMGMAGLAILVAGLALASFSLWGFPVTLAIFVAVFGALMLTNVEWITGWMGIAGMVALVVVLVLVFISVRSFLFAFAAVVAIIGILTLKSAGVLSGICSSEKKHQVKILRKGIEADTKEFQAKVNPMVTNIKELLERTEKILREQDAVQIEDIAELTSQMFETMRLTESIATVGGGFSLVIDIFSVIENNRVLDELQDVAETHKHEEMDEHVIKTKVGKFIVGIKKRINRLQHIVDKLQRIQEQLAVY